MKIDWKERAESIDSILLNIKKDFSNFEEKAKETCLFNKAGNLNTTFLVNDTFKESKFYRFVFALTKEIDEAVPFSMRINFISRRIFQHPKCEICDNRVNYLRGKGKFAKYCSLACSNKGRTDPSKQIVKKVKKTKKSKPQKKPSKKRLSFIKPLNLSIDCNDVIDEIYNFIKTSYSGKVVKGEKADIWIPDKNLAIDYLGLKTHCEANGFSKFTFINKSNSLAEEGIQLICIFEDEWVYKKDICESRLLNLLHIIPNRIFARKCEIKEIESFEKNEFIERCHIQGSGNSKVKIGLFYRDKLVSVMTFAKPRYNKAYDWEIIRFCNELGYSVVGGASKIYKYFLRTYKPAGVISYADKRWSQGNLYRQLGLDFVRVSEPCYWYFKQIERLHRSRYQKHKLHKHLEDFDPEMTEVENMYNHGWNRVWDCGNEVFGIQYEDI